MRPPPRTNRGGGLTALSLPTRDTYDDDMSNDLPTTIGELFGFGATRTFHVYFDDGEQKALVCVNCYDDGHSGHDIVVVTARRDCPTFLDLDRVCYFCGNLC